MMITNSQDFNYKIDLIVDEFPARFIDLRYWLLYVELSSRSVCVIGMYTLLTARSPVTN